MLHEVLDGRHLTKVEFQHELPKLQDRLLDAQFVLRKDPKRAVAVIVTGIPGAGRSEVVNELLGWLDPKFVTIYGFGAPNDVERQRPAMWRYWRVMPPRGRIAILHAGWYEDFLSGSVLDPDDRRRKCGGRWSGSAASSGCWWRTALRWSRCTCTSVPSCSAATAQAACGQAHALAGHAGGPAGMAAHYRPRRAGMEHCLEATEQPAAPWHLVDGTDRQHRALEVGRVLLAGIEGRIGKPRARAGARGANCGEPREAVRQAADVSTAARASRRRTTSASSRSCRAGSRCCRAATASRSTPSSWPSKAWTPRARAARSGASPRRSMRGSIAWCRSRRRVPEEIARPYLWRFWFHLPPRGNYTVFDRSWYGRVLVERVRGFAAKPDWQRAYEEINEFERAARRAPRHRREVLDVGEPRRAARALRGA